MPEQNLPSLRANALLAALPESARERVAEVARIVELPMRHVVGMPRQPIEHVHFPLSLVISLTVAPDGDDPIEIATIGNEGMYGATLLLGAADTEEVAMVQVAGVTAIIDAERFRAVAEQSAELTAIVHRYVAAMLASAGISAACNRLHSIPQRCARWLLLTHDRVGTDRFPLTQEFMAQMLGVRRPTVSVVASNLQEEGLIRYVRGVITIVDRAGLERTTCSCYRFQRSSYARFLPNVSNG
jgi:CRP-like cAMP-binding protein